ncbi:MAG TPA: DUF3108 domain-containing protein [Bryobacteraceae bacterium]|jgi:hypothetical protein|nr:DUF3108 domain-containing protein [Bryobacteraceae bacterium]
MRFFAGATALLSTAWAQTLTVPSTERLTYDIEWRLIHAGTAVVDAQKTSAHMKLESAGLVSTLFKVDDAYGVTYDEPFCATSATLDAQEGKRHHETRVTFDRTRNRADYVERDLLKNAVLHTYDTAIPNCVHDTLGALISLRGLSLSPGQSVQMPVSDGHHSASVKIEAQDRETIKTAASEYKTIRCETFLMNGIVYNRKGRVFIWLTDDVRRLPVQIQLRMSFPVGTVTLHLLKEEKL